MANFLLLVLVGFNVGSMVLALGLFVMIVRDGWSVEWPERIALWGTASCCLALNGLAFWQVLKAWSVS